MRPRRRAGPLTVLVAALAMGCQTANPTATPAATDTSTRAADASQGPGDATGNPGQPGATSEELIAAALAAGSITYEDSLFDRALALFNSPGLPEAFRSIRLDLDAGTALFAEIEAAQPGLSPAVMSKLAPFLVRPTDPTSIFSTPPTAQAGEVVFAEVSTTGWISMPAADGAALVWVQQSPGADRRLKDRAAQVSRVWTAYEDVFAYPDADAPNLPSAAVNPTPAVDFYFVEASALDPRRPDCSDAAAVECTLESASAEGFARVAEPRRANASSAYFVLNAGSGSSDRALFELAHELAHGGEFHFDSNESPWLAESTANWVAYRVFQKLGIKPDPAYGWLDALFAHLDRPLTSEGDQWPYRAWLYLQFAAMQRGDAIVTQIWQAAGKAGAQGASAVDIAFPFADHFADFAVRNWNQEPVPNRYRTAPDTTFPNDVPSVRKKTQALKAGDEVELDVALPHLASAYYTFGFDPSARKITFDNRLNGLDGAHVWAIEEIDGTWHEPEDWTAAAKKEFCRDNPAENLSQLVIIVSYAELVGDLDAGGANPKVTGKAAGCGGWKGTMTATHTWHNDYGDGLATSTLDGVWTANTDPISSCQGPLPTSCTVYLPTGTITWSWHSVNTGFCSEDNAGTLPAGVTPILTTQILILSPTSDPTKLQYWAAGGFQIPERLTCADTITGSVLSPPAYIDLSEDDAASNPVSSNGNTCHSTTWQIDATATTITGSCYAWNTGFNSLQFEWSLTRIGPPPG